MGYQPTALFFTRTRGGGRCPNEGERRVQRSRHRRRGLTILDGTTDAGPTLPLPVAGGLLGWWWAWRAKDRRTESGQPVHQLW